MKQEMNSVSLVVIQWPIYEDTAFRPKKKKRKEEKRKEKKRKEKKRKERKEISLSMKEVFYPSCQGAQAGIFM